MQLNLIQASARSGLSVGYLDLLCKTGILPHRRPAGPDEDDGIRISAADIDDFMSKSSREARRYGGRPNATTAVSRGIRRSEEARYDG